MARNFNQEKFDEQTNGKKFDEKTVAEICAEFEKQAKQASTKVDELVTLMTYIDLTTLAGDDTPERVYQLVDKALNPFTEPLKSKLLALSKNTLRCAAVCVYPARVEDVVHRLKQHPTSEIQIASVAGGFPSGQYKLATRINEVSMAVEDGATEIDIVINRSAALTNDWKTVHDEVRDMKIACGTGHMKTILATGELNTFDNIYKASWAAMLAGSDFIKTSTGKETVNATLPVSYVMCTAIKDYFDVTGVKIGFKPAGGIRTVEEALAYRCLVEQVLGEQWLKPQLFRIGASSLLANIETALHKLITS